MSNVAKLLSKFLTLKSVEFLNTKAMLINRETRSHISFHDRANSSRTVAGDVMRVDRFARQK